jgi:hypothetical protein
MPVFGIFIWNWTLWLGNLKLSAAQHGTALELKEPQTAGAQTAPSGVVVVVVVSLPNIRHVGVFYLYTHILTAHSPYSLSSFLIPLRSFFFLFLSFLLPFSFSPFICWCRFCGLFFVAALRSFGCCCYWCNDILYVVVWINTLTYTMMRQIF